MPAMGSLATGQFNPAAHIGKAGHDPATLETLLALGDQITRGPKWHDALGSFSGRSGRRRWTCWGSAARWCSRLSARGRSSRPAHGALWRGPRAQPAMAEFCKPTARLIGVAVVPLDDPDQAMAEMEYAAGRAAARSGCRASAARRAARPATPTWSRSGRRLAERRHAVHAARGRRAAAASRRPG